MSVYATTTNATAGDSYFVLNNANPYMISSLNVMNGSLNTNHIQLDQIGMDCQVVSGTPQLLLNGAVVATGGSFTSSITSWATYPALTTVNYSPGFGGILNMSNVNALGSLSSQTAKLGTLVANSGTVGGFAVPTVPSGANIITALGSSTVITTSGQQIIVDFTGQPAGYYVIWTNFGTGTFAEFFTACFTVIWGGSIAYGGGTHLPSYIGNPPTLGNAVICQRLGNNETQLELLIFYATPMSLAGSTCTVSVARIT